MCNAEFLSSNPQMQILTCFGHCGADCQVRVATAPDCLADVEAVYTALLDVDAVARLRIYTLANGGHNGDRSVDLDDTRMMTWLLLTP
jgi:hypothetical protein